MVALRHDPEPRSSEHTEIMADNDLAEEQVLPPAPCGGSGSAIQCRTRSHFCPQQALFLP